jgi:hypothetical protein
MAREVEMSDAETVPAAAAPAAAAIQPQDPEKAVFAGERLVNSRGRLPIGLDQK